MQNLTSSSITQSSSNTTPVVVGDSTYVSVNSDGVKRVQFRTGSGNWGYVNANTLIARPVSEVVDTLTSSGAFAATCSVVYTNVMKYTNDGSTHTSSSKDCGSNASRGVYMTMYNIRTGKIQGSNNNSSWTDVASGSCNGNSDGNVGNPATIYASNLTYRYYRAVMTGYNNGNANIAWWGIFGVTTSIA